jgi:DUF2075 family protein
MPKSGEDRAAKYAAKFDAEVIRSRYAATSTIAKTAQETKQRELATIATDVRNILNTEGIPAIYTAAFLSFANKLYGIVNKFERDAAVYQANLEYTKWAHMVSPIDADASVLKQVWNIFSDKLGTKS